jgi:hypothetical protein
MQVHDFLEGLKDYRPANSIDLNSIEKKLTEKILKELKVVDGIDLPNLGRS